MTNPPSTPPSVEDLLFGSGPSRKGRSLSFLNIGDSHTMTVTGKEVRQPLDDETGEPATWSDGNPKWQIVLTGETVYRDSTIEDDDGVRYLYIEGSLKPSSKSKMAALAAGLQAVGIESVELGGRLTMTYVANGEKTSSDPRKSAPKQYEVIFVRPVDVATQTAVAGGNGNGAAPSSVPTPGMAPGSGYTSLPATAPAPAQVSQQSAPAPAAPTATPEMLSEAELLALNPDQRASVVGMIAAGQITAATARIVYAAQLQGVA